jgi:acetolactate synthase-1/2/3 large subunit
VVSDVGYVLKELVEMLDKEGGIARGNRHPEWLRQIEDWREAEPLRYPDREDGILPQYAIDRLWHIVRDRKKLDETIVTTGVGQHQMWAAQYYHVNSPRTWFTSGGLGAMGFGLPAAIGAQVANPDKTVIDIDGDGSFLMNIQELACAFCEKLPVKVLLLNNQHLGMVAQWEDRFFAGIRAHTYLGAGDLEAPYPDFVTLARGFRCGGSNLSRKEDLDAALEEMLDSKGPYVLDVHTPYQEHVLPMIPSGMTVHDIIKT